jgi:hypothetical protein
LDLPEPAPLAQRLDATLRWERANPPEEIDADMFDYAAEDAALLALQENEGLEPQTSS